MEEENLKELQEAVDLYKKGDTGTAIEIIKYNKLLTAEYRMRWCDEGIVAIEDFIKEWQEK